MGKGKGKKGKKGKKGAGKQGSTPAKAQPSPPSEPKREEKPPRVVEIEAANAEAATVSEGLTVQAPTSGQRPHGVDLDALWTMVNEARDRFKAAEQRANEAKETAQRRAVALDERAAKLDERELGFDQRDTKLDERAAEAGRVDKELRDRRGKIVSDETELEKRARGLKERDADLVQREAELAERELNAEFGFVEQRRTMLAVVETELESRRAELRELDEEIEEQRRAWHEEERSAREDHRRQLEDEQRAARGELDRERASRDGELAARARELAEQDKSLDERTRELDAKARELDYREEDLEEVRENLDARVEQRSAATRESLEHQLQSLQARLEQAQRDRDAHAETIRRREDADRRFGQRTPEELIEELDNLRATVKQQDRELADRLDASQTARLRELEQAQREWLLERQELERSRSELQRRLTRANADVGERETQRDVIASLESQRELLSEAHDQLRTEVEDLLSRSAVKSPFPACLAMDKNAELQAAPAAFVDQLDLEKFVEDLRHRIAHDPDHPERRLYYTPEDLRSFLAGLAMTRLLLLQGISGTGKTSLPLAFARAVGTKPTVVEVQAGWRDPQDLVGHYNTFEKRFYEGEFLKALYRAQTRKWKDGVHIIVLDEMNLSHPEQYFSDMLSALERKPEERRLRLMSHAIPQPPQHFVEDSKLLIPNNVWFVGTANHDETTKDFADKTYDRSHVMEFKDEIEAFKVTPPSPRAPISFAALEDAFAAAVKDHASKAAKAIGFLNSQLRGMLGRNFEVGWGPRLERQLLRYIPVVIAAGGTIGEATDRMLAMRLLRKLKNRHDNRPERIEALKRQIEESWSALDDDHVPMRSIRLLDTELARLGHSVEEDV